MGGKHEGHQGRVLVGNFREDCSWLVVGLMEGRKRRLAIGEFDANEMPTRVILHYKM